MRPIQIMSLSVAAFLAHGCASTTKVGANEEDAALADGGAVRTGPYDECGNGMDDDGDGQIDEGCICGGGETQPCFTGMYPSRRVGACADGVQACTATGGTEFGAWAACVMDTLPSAEVCDGVDNDCDGAVDDGCPCTAGESRECGGDFRIAPCTPGMQTCQPDGSWSGCEGAIGPSAELCGGGAGDGIDNDCDGSADEGCSCLPEPEICRDGIDNDCDGAVDEPACGAPSVCEGQRCSGHGRCAVIDSTTAACVCDPGYLQVGLGCYAEGDPCAGVLCSGHGTCSTGGDGSPQCTCDDGFEAVGSSCIHNIDESCSCDVGPGVRLAIGAESHIQAIVNPIRDEVAIVGFDGDAGGSEAPTFWRFAADGTPLGMPSTLPLPTGTRGITYGPTVHWFDGSYLFVFIDQSNGLGLLDYHIYRVDALGAKITGSDVVVPSVLRSRLHVTEGDLVITYPEVGAECASAFGTAVAWNDHRLLAQAYDTTLRPVGAPVLVHAAESSECLSVTGTVTGRIDGDLVVQLGGWIRVVSDAIGTFRQLAVMKPGVTSLGPRTILSSTALVRGNDAAAIHDGLILVSRHNYPPTVSGSPPASGRALFHDALAATIGEEFDITPPMQEISGVPGPVLRWVGCTFLTAEHARLDSDPATAIAWLGKTTSVGATPGFEEVVSRPLPISVNTNLEVLSDGTARWIYRTGPRELWMSPVSCE